MDNRFQIELQEYIYQHLVHEFNLRDIIDGYTLIDEIPSLIETRDQSSGELSEETIVESQAKPTPEQVRRTSLRSEPSGNKRVGKLEISPSFLKKSSEPSGPTNDMEEYLRRMRNKDTFSTLLFKYVYESGLSNAEIYKRAGIDRRHFSKIRCDREYQPKKQTVIALCLALRLKLQQTEEMLGLAGYSLSNCDTGDLVVKFCIEKGKYDLMEVNEALDYLGAKVLGD